MSSIKYPSDKRRCRISIRLEHAVILYKFLSKETDNIEDHATYNAFSRIRDLLEPQIVKALSYVEDKHEREFKLIRELKQGISPYK